jgi:glycosyltransferase involved in cell wall biosynthesis
MGVHKVDTIATGVDADYFSPRAVAARPYSCVLWGRLDFGPNIDAVRWFVTKAWPGIREQFPTASFTVFGFRLTGEIQRLAEEYAFEVIQDLPDLRDAVCGHQVVVLPFISGAGIKNKLLEAAAMGRPIVASPRAVNGLEKSADLPCLIANNPQEWLEKLSGLWDNEEQRTELGRRARRWALEHATWKEAAQNVLAEIDEKRRS